MDENSEFELKDLSKFIAYILRHKPTAAGISLDENGWADTNELLRGINSSGRKIDFDILKTIVVCDDKNRYSFNEDYSKIRANQGHSIKVDLHFEQKIPPNFLYHGTAEKYIDNIKQQGIEKKNRNYVHISADEQTALKVGSRHGTPVVLKIDAAQMHADGYKFYLSENGVWQTEHVPYKYVTILKKGT